MTYERPDPRLDLFDARLRDLPGSSLHPLLAAVSEIDAFRGWWQGRFSPPPPYLAGRREKTVAAAVAACARIAWSGLPTPARGERPARPGPSRPAAERYGKLLRRIFERHGEMTPGADLLSALQADLTVSGGRGSGTAPAYRTVPDPPVFFPRRGTDVAILRTAEPDRIAAEMTSLLAWANGRLAERRFHPLLVAAGFVLELLAIRPFPDGNVRLSRLLTQLLMLRCGYAFVPYASLDRAIAEQMAEYYIALRKAQGTLALPRSDVTPWLRAFLSPLRSQVRELRGILGPVPPEARLSKNQEAVLRLLDRHGEVTVRLVVREIGVPRETAKQVFSRLLMVGAVARAGAGRAARYRAANEGG